MLTGSEAGEPHVAVCRLKRGHQQLLSPRTVRGTREQLQPEAGCRELPGESLARVLRSWGLPSTAVAPAQDKPGLRWLASFLLVSRLALSPLDSAVHSRGGVTRCLPPQSLSHRPRLWNALAHPECFTNFLVSLRPRKVAVRAGQAPRPGASF